MSCKKLSKKKKRKKRKERVFFFFSRIDVFFGNAGLDYFRREKHQHCRSPQSPFLFQQRASIGGIFRFPPHVHRLSDTSVDLFCH
ncbi:Uncharacterized protein APZ42_023149 [Daphnia magna]|uniref:Uncharacterized protein n=1 Tax=Daphnia magna TaxID=35525 RepID=A0A164V7X7_9CRUS|nr:Uncharacterized protein APZ42_023149 [Daphnia magna]